MSARVSKDKEIEKLKKENAKLRADVKRLNASSKSKTAKPKSTFTREFFRKAGVVVFISLAVALLTVGNLIFWFGNTVVKQDRYVAATSPIIKDPEVQQAMALYTTNMIFQNVDVEQVTEDVLPPRADFLAPQLAGQLKTGVNSFLQKLLANPEFQERWNSVNERQHQRLIDFAAQYEGDDKISLNEIFNQLTNNLKSTKLAFLADKNLPSNVGEITVVESSYLPLFHNVVTNIDTWRSMAIGLLVVCLALAVWLSRNRRKALYIFSIFSIIFLTATLVAGRVVRESVAGSVDPQYAEGVRSAYTILFHPFVIQTATIILAAFLLGLIAWISGDSRSALSVKKQISLIFGGKLHDSIFGDEVNQVSAWVGKHKRALDWTVVGVITVIMLMIRLTPITLLVSLLVMIVLVLIIEVIGGQPSKSKRK